MTSVAKRRSVRHALALMSRFGLYLTLSRFGFASALGYLTHGQNIKFPVA